MDFKPKLVAFDLDGTLAESKQRVTAHMGELLGELLANMPVAVMSGGSYAQFETQLMVALPSDAKLENLYLFPTNAARCYVYKDREWHIRYDESFDKTQLKKIMQELTQAMADTGLGVPPPHTWGERVEDRGAQVSFSALGQNAPVDAKREWNKLHNEERVQLSKSLTVRLPDFSVAMGGFTTIDITRKGVTKAYGIRQLAGLTGISVSEMLYVGDALQEGGNDYVVVETGVHTHQVFGSEETEKLIGSVLAQH